MVWIILSVIFWLGAIVYVTIPIGQFIMFRLPYTSQHVVDKLIALTKTREFERAIQLCNYQDLNRREDVWRNVFLNTCKKIFQDVVLHNLDMEKTYQAACQYRDERLQKMYGTVDRSYLWIGSILVVAVTITVVAHDQGVANIGAMFVAPLVLLGGILGIGQFHRRYVVPRAIAKDDQALQHFKDQLPAARQAAGK